MVFCDFHTISTKHQRRGFFEFFSWSPRSHFHLSSLFHLCSHNPDCVRSDIVTQMDSVLHSQFQHSKRVRLSFWPSVAFFSPNRGHRVFLSIWETLQQPSLTSKKRSLVPGAEERPLLAATTPPPPIPKAKVGSSDPLYGGWGLDPTPWAVVRKAVCNTVHILETQRCWKFNRSCGASRFKHWLFLALRDTDRFADLVCELCDLNNRITCWSNDPKKCFWDGIGGLILRFFIFKNDKKHTIHQLVFESWAFKCCEFGQTVRGAKSPLRRYVCVFICIEKTYTPTWGKRFYPRPLI